MRSDDAETLISAIKQIRGVLAVTGNPITGSDWVAEQRVRMDLTEKLWAVLQPKQS